MKKSKRLQPIAKIARSRERGAASALGLAKQNHAREVLRLEQLIEYRSEYIERFNRNATKGMNGLNFMEYQRFITQLDAAIEQQKKVVEQHQENVSDRLKHWQQHYTRLSAVSQVIDNHVVSEQKEDDKRDQRETDEFVNQRAATERLKT